MKRDKAEMPLCGAEFGGRTVTLYILITYMDDEQRVRVNLGSAGCIEGNKDALLYAMDETLVNRDVKTIKTRGDVIEVEVGMR